MSQTSQTSQSSQTSRSRRGYRSSLSGLVGALIVCLVLVAVVALMTLFQKRDRADPVRTVDFTAQLALAREQAPFDVLAPSPVPDGWRATSASWQGVGPEKSWHLGFLTGSDEYVGLEQGNAVAAAFISDHTRADHPGAPVTIDGTTWQSLTGGGDTALVQYAKHVTTVVSGTASKADLVAFASSLSSS